MALPAVLVVLVILISSVVILTAAPVRAETMSGTVTLPATNQSVVLQGSSRTTATAIVYDWQTFTPSWSTSATTKVQRIIMVFDLSAIPEGATITSAIINMYCSDKTTTTGVTYCSVADAPPYTMDDFALSGFTSIGAWSPTGAHWNNVTMSSTSSLVAGSVESIGVVMTNDYNGGSAKSWDYYDFRGSSYSDASLRPSLTISYEANGWRPSWTTNAPDSCIAGNSYTYTPGTNESTTITAPVLPSWLTWNGGTLSGTPSAAGSYSVSLKAVSAGLLPSYQNWMIVVRQWAPGWTSAPGYAVIEGSTYSYTPTLNESATITTLTVPSWLTWDGTGLSGTPASSNIGAHVVSLSAVGPGKLTSYHNWTITVQERGRWMPTVSSSPADSVEVGRPYSYILAANESVSVTYSGPGWLTWDGSKLTGTAPSTPQTGHASLAITSITGTLTTWQNWTLTVWASAPVIQIPADETIESGQDYGYSFGGSGWGSGGDRSLSVDNPPDWLDYDPVNGTMSGTPIYPGTYIVKGNITNITSGVSTPFEQIVTVPAEAPVDGSAAHEGTEDYTDPDTGVTVSLPCDTIWTGTHYEYVLNPDPDRCTVTLTTDAGWLHLGSANSTVWGTPLVPGQHFVSAYFYDPIMARGVYHNWTVIVLAPPPVIGSSATFHTLTHDSWSYVLIYSPADALLNITGLPDWMTYDNATHTFSGTPHQAGTYSYTITLTNATSGMEATQTVTVIVDDDAPVLICNPQRTGQERVLYRWTASADQTVVWSMTTDAGSWLVIDPQTGRVQGTPDAAGTYTVTVTATNDRGISASYTYELTVKPYSSSSGSTDNGSSGGGNITLPGGIEIPIGGTASLAVQLPVIALVIVLLIVLLFFFRRRDKK